jgi:hypothetical protein
VDDDVGDVAMNEELAGEQADDLVGRNTAVGTADPEIFRRLLRSEGSEEIRLRRGDPLRPQPVVVEEA